MNGKSLPWIVTAVAVAAVIVVLALTRTGPVSRHPEPRPGVTAADVIPASTFARSEQRVRAYTAAAQTAGVLDGLYCYCGCKESIGHVSLLSCFESEHGASCDICMEEAELAARMHGEGADLERIRRAIDRQFGS
ncbi:MAG: hypothetical protein HY705_08385 [Gemmatimonadetes bacterium]|nr:hypothetical protein [Gemmatimonadota bacterium]